MTQPRSSVTGPHRCARQLQTKGKNRWWLIPGGQWLAIISRPPLEGFSAACTPDVALGLSAAEGPVVDPAAVRHFFNITRTMYDGFAFVHEAREVTRPAPAAHMLTGG